MHINNAVCILELYIKWTEFIIPITYLSAPFVCSARWPFLKKIKNPERLNEIKTWIFIQARFPPILASYNGTWFTAMIKNLISDLR